MWKELRVFTNTSMAEFSTSSQTTNLFWVSWLVTAQHQHPPILSPQMLHWTLFLAAYNYRLLYRPGKLSGHIDALSGWPLPTLVEDLAPSSAVLLIEELPAFPLSAADVTLHSSKDRTISRVLNWVWRGDQKGQLIQSSSISLNGSTSSLLTGGVSYEETGSSFQPSFVSESFMHSTLGTQELCA